MGGPRIQGVERQTRTRPVFCPHATKGVRATEVRILEEFYSQVYYTIYEYSTQGYFLRTVYFGCVYLYLSLLRRFLLRQIHCRLADAGLDQYGERSGERGKTARECDQKPAEPDGSVALQYSERLVRVSARKLIHYKNILHIIHRKGYTICNEALRTSHCDVSQGSILFLGDLS